MKPESRHAAEDDALLDEILDALSESPRVLVERLRAFYRDADRADRTERSVLYFHLGLLAGALALALDRLDGQTQTEPPKTGDVPPG